MKPKIWKRGDYWCCSYYPNSCIEVYKGRTAYIAWYLWKYHGFHGVRVNNA